MTVCVCVVHVLFNRLYGIIQSRITCIQCQGNHKWLYYIEHKTSHVVTAHISELMASMLVVNENIVSWVIMSAFLVRSCPLSHVNCLFLRDYTKLSCHLPVRTGCI